ncbi:hypothetical protein OSG_eHP25_00130 [environmental Halophage eHP-25]|nr:hypothetical protein OSG_eHP25_00130 [environmental Halophage eHP-25]
MNDFDARQLLDDIGNLLQFSVGGSGFDRITATTTTNNDKTYYAIVAVNGTATLGANTTVNSGDAPSGDDITQDATRFGDFDDLEVTSGTVYAYYK